MAAFILTAITNDAGLAMQADAGGVDRIGVDIERLNKKARQGHIQEARISDHALSDLDRLSVAVSSAALFARLNPLYGGSLGEIEEALDRGASVLMLPFFTTAAEVDRFVGLVKGRARVVLLLETAGAVVRLHEILAVPGVEEVFVGLNDLHLAMGLANHFELVVSDLMRMVSDQVRGAGLRFRIGRLGARGRYEAAYSGRSGARAECAAWFYLVLAVALVLSGKPLDRPWRRSCAASGAPGILGSTA